jgi:hypothetical protein
LLVAVEDDRLVADAAGEWGFADLVGPGGDVPSVADEHGGFVQRLFRQWAGEQGSILINMGCSIPGA